MSMKVSEVIKYKEKLRDTFEEVRGILDKKASSDLYTKEFRRECCFLIAVLKTYGNSIIEAI